MSSVWRSWMRSDASALAGFVAAVPAGVVVGAVGGVHAVASARSREASRRRTDAMLARGGLMSPVLELIEAVVDAALREEILVRAHLNDAALVQHDDPVDVLDGRETVSDDDRRPAGHELRERVLDEVLGLRVDRRRGLVEHEQDLRVEGDGASEREQLLLTD